GKLAPEIGEAAPRGVAACIPAAAGPCHADGDDPALGPPSEIIRSGDGVGALHEDADAERGRPLGSPTVPGGLGTPAAPGGGSGNAAPSRPRPPRRQQFDKPLLAPPVVDRKLAPPGLARRGDVPLGVCPRPF